MAEPTPPTGKKFGRWVYALAILSFLAYVAWIMGPYLRSIVVRDAAVTSWLNVATSPIDGTLEIIPQSIAGSVGAGGIIEIVRNNHLSRDDLIQAQIQLDFATVRVKEVRTFLDEIVTLDTGRGELKASYADIFRAQLDAKIAGVEREISVTRNGLELLRAIAARHDSLRDKGHTSQAATDEAWLRVWELEWQLAQLLKDISYARVQREAANNGVFITADGEDPEWVRGSRMELKLQKKDAYLELRQAEAQLRSAKAALRAAEEDHHRRTEGFIRAPVGSILWSRVNQGATVRAGDPVAEWLDCSVLLVDVPLADAEVSLVEIGMEADVVLEGDSVVRKAPVLLTRGSAFTLGRKDLAALAKGRGEGIAQVLLDFSHERKNFNQCPVGRAAYVDFPDIGLIDIILARLRL